MSNANENAVKLIENCLLIINDQAELERLTNLIIQMRINLATTKTRTYRKKEIQDGVN